MAITFDSGRINPGSTMAAGIDYNGDTDMFATALIGGLTYTATARGASSGNGTLADPNISLYTLSGTRLFFNDDISAGVNRDAQISFTINPGYTATYGIQVGEQGNNATGSYKLTLSAGYATNVSETVNGTSYNDAIMGLDGNDVIRGGGGYDLLNGGNHNDTLMGDAANDRLFGVSGNDMLHGGTGYDSLYGGTGNDVLRGADNNDYLRGETGADRLIGGTGNDTFVFSFTNESTAAAPDHIAAGDGATAMQGVGVSGGDVIDLRGIDANVGVSGNQAFAWSLSKAAGTLSLSEDTAGNTIVSGHVNNDGYADFRLVIEDGAIRATDYSSYDFLM